MSKARKGIILRVEVNASAFGAIYRLEGCRYVVSASLNGVALLFKEVRNMSLSFELLKSDFWFVVDLVKGISLLNGEC